MMIYFGLMCIQSTGHFHWTCCVYSSSDLLSLRSCIKHIFESQVLLDIYRIYRRTFIANINE